MSVECAFDAEVARVAVEWSEQARRTLMARRRALADADTAEAAQIARADAWITANAVAVARVRVREQRDLAVIRASETDSIKRLKNGPAILRGYTAAVTREFRRQQRAFDAYAAAHGLIHIIAARPKPQRGAPARTRDAGDLSGYEPGFDPTDILPYQVSAYEAAGQRALAQLGFDQFTFSLTSPTYTKAVHDLLLDQVQGIDDNTLRGLKRVLERMAGSTPGEVGAAISDYWGQRSLAGGIRIAVTEMARASANAEVTTYGNNGITSAIWAGESADPEGETDCNNFIGETFPLTEAEGLIPLHPNCACYWDPVIEATWDSPSEPWDGGDDEASYADDVDPTISSLADYAQQQSDLVSELESQYASRPGLIREADRLERAAIARLRRQRRL